MKKINKFLSVVLALIMVISIIPMSGITAYAETTSGSCGENLTWKFDSETGTLTISGSGDMYDYYLNTVPWLNIKSNVQEIVFDGEITYIGSHAFCGFTNITSIDIPESVTKIGQSAFSDCTQLETVAIPDSVTYLDGYVFADCTNLKKAVFGKGLTETGDHTFSGCERLKNVVIPDNIEIISDGTFWFCSNLDSVTIPQSIKKIGHSAFEHCMSFETVNLPASVTEIGEYAFSNCDNLKEFIVDSDNKYFCNDEQGILFNRDQTILRQYPIGLEETTYIIPQSVTHIDKGAFSEAKIRTISIPENVKSIGWMAFERCFYLTTVYISESVEVIERYAFDNYYDFTDVYYASTKAKWNSIDMGDDNDSLLNANIHYEYSCPSRHTYVNNEFLDGECESEEIEIRYCLYCNKTIKTKTGRIIPHEYTEFTTEKEPTCSEYGLEVRCCENCDYTETGLVDKISHSPQNAVEENYVVPTFTETGSKDIVVYCSVCNEVISRETIVVSFTGIKDDHFYKDGVRLSAYQLVELDGDFYYIGDRHKIIKNKEVYVKAERTNGLTYADGTPIKAGTYSFDENGKMVILNGVVGNNIYNNNVQLKAYQLVEVDGDFYYIGDRHQIVKNKTVYVKEERINGLTYEDGTPIKAGTYTFDEDGKMIILNGPVGDYFYKNNERLNAYQLVEFEGEFYYIGDRHQIVKNKDVYVKAERLNGLTYADGTPIKAGAYTFDADGKLIKE